MPVILAIICCVVLAGLVVLQVLLAAGAPLGRFVRGGQWDVLPGRERGFAALVAVGYAVAGFVVLEGADILSVLPALPSEVATFVFAALFFAGFVLTAMSRGEYERRLMLPVNLALAALFLIVAVTGHLKF